MRSRTDAGYVIEVENLTKTYADTRVVDDATFVVYPGRVTGFLGPNGAGKSTTIRMMLGLSRPDTGTALVNGRAYEHLTWPIRQVGALLETARPHKSMTAIGHLRWLAASNQIARHRADEVLEMVDLAHAARRRVNSFSLGMSQRLCLAAALLGDPEVLVLDEPVNGLDAEGIRWLRDLLRGEAAKGRTVFIASHLMSEMSMVADHLIVMDRARILADASLADFLTQHAPTVVRVRTPLPGQLSQEMERAGATVRLDADGALVVDRISTAAINRLADEHQIPLDDVATRTGSLEDAFLDLVGQGGVR